MNKTLSFLLSLILAFASAYAKQTEESYEPTDGSQGYRYLLHLPAGAKKQNPNKKWPLLVFLHGRGERGDDLNRVKVHGPPKLAEKRDMDFIVVSPQCPKSDLWWKPKIVAGLIDEVTSKHDVDKDRIYLTGLSQGGFGTWATAAAYPRKFAAVAPICGGGKAENAKKYGKLPIWNFHGDVDRAVPVKLSRNLVAAIKKAGGNVKYTEYAGVGHNSWTATYENPKLYEWFLSHKR